VKQSIARLLILSNTIAVVPVCEGGEQPSLRATAIQEPPVIDGKLDDVCWKQAAAAGGFASLDSLAPARQATTVRVVYDEANLYVGWYCHETDTARLTREPGPPDEYRMGAGVELFLDLNRDRRTFCQFVVSAGNTYYDGRRNDDRWNCPADHATHIGEQFWSVEMAIPFAGLDLGPDTAGAWGIQFGRSDATGGELEYSAWSPTEEGFNAPDRFGTLTGLQVDGSRYWWTVSGVPRKAGRGEPVGEISLRNGTPRPLAGELRATLVSPSGRQETRRIPLSLAAGEEGRPQIPLHVDEKGPHRLRLALVDEEKALRLWREHPIRGVDVVEVHTDLRVYSTESGGQILVSLNTTEPSPGILALAVRRTGDGRSIASREWERPAPGTYRLPLDTGGAGKGDYVARAVLEVDGQPVAQARHEFMIRAPTEEVAMDRARTANTPKTTTLRRVDYQWLPSRQETAIKTKAPHGGVGGLAVDANGDWLLLTRAGIALRDDSRGGAVLWRSYDRGKSWSKAAVLPEVLPGEHLLKDYRHYYVQLFVTRQGRLVVYGEHWRKEGSVQVPHAEDGSDLDEDPPGRQRVAMAGWLYPGVKMSVATSDDKGKTWRSTIVDGGSLACISSHCDGGFHEAENGDLVIAVRGWFEEPGPWGWTPATGYIRSSDGGETWSTPHIVFKDKGQQGLWFNETAVLPRHAGPWFAMARANPLLRVQKPGSHGFLGGYRSFSHDEGKTWTLPEPFTDAIAIPRLLELKDGGILMAAGRWGALYMQISYDGGHSSAYGLEVPRSGGGVGAWIHPDAETLVAAHSDISGKDVVLTTFTRQPTRRIVTAVSPGHPSHRWTMRDLKNLHFDERLKPYCAAARCEDGTVVVAGATGGTAHQVIAIRSTDPWNEWSAAGVVAEAGAYRNIYPMCMTTAGDGALTIVCTEADDRLDHPEIFPLGKDQWGTPTLLRTLVSRDSGQSWEQVDATEAVGTLRCLRPGSRMFRDEDGRLVLPVSALDGNDLSVVGTLRRQGGGWSSFHPIARSDKAEDVYDHPAVLALEDGKWLAVFRACGAEYRIEYENSKGRTLRQPPLWCAWSEDDGKSWSQPAHLWSAHYPHLLRLPDGALMLTDISGSHLQYRISHNHGVSWSSEDTVIHYPSYGLYRGGFAMSALPVIVLDEHTLLGAYFCNDAHEGGPRLAATWFRALPAASFEARERGL